jgi:metal-responsive CopG/Arc/MetJ family transcriptional regulator
MKKPAKRMGRPPKPLDQKFVDVGLKLPPAMLEQIDSMVSVEAGVDRSTTIRQLLAEALAARQKKGKR